MRRQLEPFDDSYMTIGPGCANRSLRGSRLCASNSRSTYNRGNMMDSETRHLLTDVMAVHHHPRIDGSPDVVSTSASLQRSRLGRERASSGDWFHAIRRRVSTDSG